MVLLVDRFYNIIDDVLFTFRIRTWPKYYLWDPFQYLEYSGSKMTSWQLMAIHVVGTDRGYFDQHVLKPEIKEWLDTMVKHRWRLQWFDSESSPGYHYVLSFARKKDLMAFKLAWKNVDV